MTLVFVFRFDLVITTRQVWVVEVLQSACPYVCLSVRMDISKHMSKFHPIFSMKSLINGRKGEPARNLSAATSRGLVFVEQ